MQVSGNVYEKHPAQFFYGFDAVNRLRQTSQANIDSAGKLSDESNRLRKEGSDTSRLDSLIAAQNRLGDLLNVHFREGSQDKLFSMMEGINGDSFPVADPNSQFFIPFALATGLDISPLPNFRRLPDWASDVSGSLSTAAELELNRIKSLNLKTSTILSPRLLIAEDSEDILERLEFIFTNAGFKVTAVINGLEALEAFKSGEFDVVITDNDMPLMTGLDLVDNIRNLNSTIPIIMFTGNSQLIKNPIRGVNASIDKMLTRQGEQEFIERARGFVAEAARKN